MRTLCNGFKPLTKDEVIYIARSLNNSFNQTLQRIPYIVFAKWKLFFTVSEKEQDEISILMVLWGLANTWRRHKQQDYARLKS